MAGSMNWSGMEELIDAVNKTKDNWTTTAENIKTEAVNKLNEGYTGVAAETTISKMDEIIKEATAVFDKVANQLSSVLTEQKIAWQQQEAKAQNSVEG